MALERHPLSPCLDHCPEGLPKEAYLSPDWYAREMATVFAQQWICVGRLADFAVGRMRRATLGLAEVILCRAADGAVSAYHNACRHRGSELCVQAEEPLGKLIRCPYHAWSYAAKGGQLVATGYAKPTDDFVAADHGLRPVQHRIWNGFVFLNAGTDSTAIGSDVGLETLDNWPMDGLVTGHRWETELACNWKSFWENYSECLHCPGIHPELCDLVPIYGSGIMGRSEALGWTPDHDNQREPNLKPDAQTWTTTGKPCGSVFAGLTDADLALGHSFVTMWPSVYVVAHVDYVRSVRVQPLGPERTRLVAEWHFSTETLNQPDFDPAEVAAFAITVMNQDGAASEMNQRGLRSPSFAKARLMPEEYEIHQFHQWLTAAMERIT
jgi:Rieske 2Fe-2S family protein